MIGFNKAFEHPAGSPIRELFPYLSRPGMISFAGGYPSASLFDTAGLAEATSKALSVGPQLLQYGATEGQASLRDELLLLCSSRGVKPADHNQLLVTSGSQQAFDLLVRVLVEPGDIVLVEAPAYPAAIQTLRLADASIVEIPMDTHGLKTDMLVNLLAGLPPGQSAKLLYTVPTFSNPRGTALSDERRLALGRLARQHGFIVVEDDPYGELAFSAAKPQTVYAMCDKEEPRGNPVVYLSSLSKTVAPALRIGWMVGPAEVVRRCTIAKQTSDMCTSPFTQMVAAEYLRSGRYATTVGLAVEEYARRMNAMADQLGAALAGHLHFDRPEGGMFLWVECRHGLDTRQLFNAAVDNGVLFVPGSAFFASQAGSQCMRLSFASPSVQDIRSGINRLTQAVQSCISQTI